MNQKKSWVGILSIGLCLVVVTSVFIPSIKAEPGGNEPYQVLGKYKIPLNWKSVPAMEISEDGKKLAYTLQSVDINVRQTTFERVTTTNSSTMLMINDKAVSPIYFDIVNFNYNENNLSYIYSYIKNNQKEYGINLNGKDLTLGYTGYPHYTYNRDGTQLIYWQRDDSGYHIMINGKPVESFPAWLVEELKARPKPYTGTVDGVIPGSIYILNKPGGREFVYEVFYYEKSMGIGRTIYIKNGQKILTGYNNISSLTFSPDGNSYACVARDKLKNFVVRDDKIISLDFTAVAFLHYTSESKLMYVGWRWKTSIWADSQQLWEDFCKMPMFHSNQDGSRVTYVANLGLKDYLVSNGRIISAKYDKITQFRFNKDETKMVYTVVLKGKSYIMMDERKITPEFSKDQEPMIICFTDDGSQICYKVSDGNKQPKYWLMVGDQPVTPRLNQLIYRLAADGKIFFAGVDMENREIVHGILKPW